jgi:hypothetical protein
VASKRERRELVLTQVALLWPADHPSALRSQTEEERSCDKVRVPFTRFLQGCPDNVVLNTGTNDSMQPARRLNDDSTLQLKLQCC